MLDLKKTGKTLNRRWNFEINKLQGEKGVRACEMRFAINLSTFIYARACRKSEKPMMYPWCISCELHRQNEQELPGLAMSILME